MKKVTGFTLIELMIVIAIVGILCSVAIPHFMEEEGAVKMVQEEDSSNQGMTKLK